MVAAKQRKRAAGSQPELPPPKAVEQTMILERAVPKRGRSQQLGGYRLSKSDEIMPCTNGR